MISSRHVESIPALPDTAAAYRAAVINAPHELTLVEEELPEPKDDEVRIKLEGCGVCASNIPVWQGRDWFEYPQAPGAPGHEGWGIIDALGKDVKGFALRERVTGLTYNAYASHDIAKPENLVTLPDFLDGKPFPGEPLGCAMNIFNRSDIKTRQTVAIVGCGFLGLLLIQLAKSAGAKVIALSQRAYSLEMAKKQGADEVIQLDDHFQIIKKVKELTEERLCQRTIECTGKEWPLNLSIELTAERGKLIVAGYHQDGMRSVNMQMLNWRGIDLISAHERENLQYIKGIKHAIEAIQLGKMNPFSLFTHSYSLTSIDQAFNNFVDRPDGFIKALMLNPKER